MSLTPIPEQHLPYSFVGPASIPLRQHINNGMTTAYMGMPFKPDTMTQGSEFSRARRIYSRVDRFKTKTSVEKKINFIRVDFTTFDYKQPPYAPRPIPNYMIGDYYEITDPVEIKNIENSMKVVVGNNCEIIWIYKNSKTDSFILNYLSINTGAPSTVVQNIGRITDLRPYCVNCIQRTLGIQQINTQYSSYSPAEFVLIPFKYLGVQAWLNPTRGFPVAQSEFLSIHTREDVIQKSKVIQALPVQKHFTSSEERIAMRKMEAIGKSSMKQGMSRTAPLSFRSQERNSRNTALSKVRGGGAVAPKKKGAIANSFKSG